jgi:hypothetical protein
MSHVVLTTPDKSEAMPHSKDMYREMPFPEATWVGRPPQFSTRSSATARFPP